jgi:hypothetical protein
MDGAGIRFAGMPWVTLGPGAREKRAGRGGLVFRLVEFSPPFEEVGWCVKGHRGFVVSGGFVLAFEGSREVLGAGDAFEIETGRAHRAVVDRPVVLFMVEG